MNDRWYCKAKGRVVGPLAATDLAKMIDDGTLAADAPVRLGTNGAWRPAAEALHAAQTEAPNASRTAAQILDEVNLARLKGAVGGEVAARPSVAAAVLGRAAGVAAAVTAPVRAVAERLNAAIGRKTILAAALIVAVAVLLRNLPTFDPPLEESHGELSAVWDEVRKLRESSAGQAEWDAFAGRALPQLEAVAVDLERSYERRLGSGLWALAFGRSRPTEAARLELLRVAKYDLPAVLRAGPDGKDVREPWVEQRLTKVGEHVAGVSPYLPPLRPSTPSAVRTGAARTGAAPAGAAWEAYALAAFFALDAAFVGSLVLMWYRRRAAA